MHQVSTLGAEQFESDGPQFSLKRRHSHNHDRTSELVRVSSADVDAVPKQLQLQSESDAESAIDDYESSLRMLSVQHKQKESFFNWFYFSINLGSFFAFTLVAYLCQNVNFGVGYTVPAVALWMGVAVFVAASVHYRMVQPGGSVLSKALRIGCYGARHCSLDRAKIAYGHDEVEAVKAVLRLFPFLCLNVMYWCVYAQLSTLFYAQGCQMDIRVGRFEIPIATLGLFDVIPILVLVPLFDRVLIPCLRRRGLRVTMLQRMGAGFVFAAASMACAGVVEAVRKSSRVSESVRSACNDAGDAHVYVTEMSIFWQVPQV